MKRFSCLIFSLFTIVPVVLSQWGSQAYRDSINKVTNEDHQAMLKQLGISSLRPGRDGMNPNSPNAANYDESKANPYPVLPDPLILNDGTLVTTSEMWWTRRRPELIELFDREVYGRVPENIPAINWVVVKLSEEIEKGVPVIKKELEGRVDNSSYPSIEVTVKLNLTVPKKASGPVPVVMEFGFIFPPGFRRPEPAPGVPVEPTWQEQVLARGWAYAVIIPTSFQADHGAGLTRGIIGLVNKGQRRKPDDWGTLRAWAWGASKAIDYFETDPLTDARKVALEGHSRYGKATLVTMAYDQRLAVAFVSSSGEGGAKLHRRDAGEIIENLCSSGEYHWMAGNFIKYGGPLSWDDLPIDAHELIALCAPRPVFISSGENGDAWIDARGMFMAAAAAGPVYKLLGKKDMGTAVFPATGTTLTGGEVAFRQHTGGHTPGPNWPIFLEYAFRYFNK
ncbi:MAG TPA: acetylxylan esterase [Bacteroidales bacterium]|nr:acetylxylan esterase [Bacteroidales bacterium]